MSTKAKPTATKEEVTPALVPKLRFPEFRDAEGWEQTALGDVARLKNGYAFKSADYVEDGPFQIITIANVQQGSLALDATKRIAQLPEEIQPHQQLQIGDILISMTGNVGRVCRVTCDSLLQNQRVGKLIAERIGSDFFYHLLQRDEFRNTMQLKAAGGAQGNLSSGDITEFALHRPPSPAEQQKIAECLSSMDELTAAQARKVDALRAHKKGLMQQLFPREGETQPRFRFPEFQNAGEWEVKTIGDVFKVTRGEVLAMTLVKEEASNEMPYPVYSSQTKNKGLAGYYSDYLYQDAITWTTDGANAGDVNFRSGRFYCTNVCGVLLNTDGHANECIAAMLNTVTRSHVSYVGNPKLMNGVMAKIEIPFPSVAEQQRIAECLGSLDELIADEMQTLEILKAHKKGLMQQLFPSPEEN